MNVLVGCEYSGTVGWEFLKQGHNVWTCDLERSECKEVPHWCGDIFTAMECIDVDHWDLIILHPPCTALCVAGNGTYAPNGIMSPERAAAIHWTLRLWDEATQWCDHVALENPVGVLSTAWRKPDQYIQPWQFGHGETKKTGLWLHNLPPLEPTDIVEGREQRIWKMAPSPDRGKERSRFYPGIAKAMATQWT